MKNLAQRLGKIIQRIEGAWDVLTMKDDGSISLPVLDGKVLDVDMAKSIHGETVVDDLDGGGIVFKDRCR